jgi:transcriptional regulator with XRE-family HTH domain
LREIIEARGLTAYAAGRLADVDPGVVSRFMTGERDIRMDTADRLASALGLRLVELARKGRARPSRAVGVMPDLDEADAD